MEKISDAMRSYQRKHLHVVGSNPPGEPKPKVYACDICKDRGYLRFDVPYGHPQFGKVFDCECTKGVKKEQQQQNLIGMSGIVRYSRYRNASFENFNRRLPGVKSAYANAKAYAEEPEGWLVIIGTNGCGKTHLAVSIAKVRIAASDTVLVQTVPDLLDHLRDAFDPHAETTFNALFEQMKTADLLILDDYGAENATAWANEKLFQIFNYRYNAMLPTVITTNIEVEHFEMRIRSRMEDGELVNTVTMTDAKDYRPNLKKQVESNQSSKEAK